MKNADNRIKELEKALKHLRNAGKALRRAEAVKTDVSLRTDPVYRPLRKMYAEITKLSEAAEILAEKDLSNIAMWKTGRPTQMNGYMTASQVFYLDDLDNKGNPYANNGR